MALQVLGSCVPGIRKLLGTVPMGRKDWTVSVVASIAPLLVNESLKLARRPRPEKLGPRQGDRSAPAHQIFERLGAARCKRSQLLDRQERLLEQHLGERAHGLRKNRCQKGQYRGGSNTPGKAQQKLARMLSHTFLCSRLWMQAHELSLTSTCNSRIGTRRNSAARQAGVRRYEGCLTSPIAWYECEFGA